MGEGSGLLGVDLLSGRTLLGPLGEDVAYLIRTVADPMVGHALSICEDAGREHHDAITHQRS